MRRLCYLLFVYSLLLSIAGHAASFIVVSYEQNIEDAHSKEKLCKELLHSDKADSQQVNTVAFDSGYLVKIGPFQRSEKLAVNYLKVKENFSKAFILDVPETAVPTPTLAPAPAPSQKVKIVEKEVFVIREVPVVTEDNTLWVALFGLAIIGILFMFLSSDQIRRLKVSQKQMTARHRELEEKQHNVLSSMGENIHTIAKEAIDQTSILAKKAEETDLHDDIQKVMLNENELLDVTKDLIGFLQLKSKKLAVHNEIFNFNHVLNEISGTLSESAEKHQIELTFDIDKSIPYMMEADSSHIGQILINLIDYYIQNSADNYVTLSAHTVTNSLNILQLKFDIKGDLQIDDHNTFFDTKYNEQSRRYINLGLFVAKELTELMGGELSIESDAHRDSLSIMLPIETSQKEKRQYRLSNKHIMDNRVLIVDYNYDAALALEKRFAYFRMQTKIMRAEHFLHNMPDFKSYDIIVLDKELFDHNTVALLQEVKQKSDLKIISLENMHRTYQSESSFVANTVLQKPFSPEYVFETIEELYDTSADKKDSVAENAPKSEQSELPIFKKSFANEPNVTLASFSAFSGKRLLLVEDNTINQKVILGILSKSNMQIDVAVNGQEAVDILKQNSQIIDFIFMDINMPVMDGFVATEKIRQDENFDHIPIVSLTAMVADHEVEKMFNLGMNGYLSKPIKVGKLFSALSLFLGTSDNIDDPQVGTIAELVDLPGLSVKDGLSHMQDNNVFYKEVLREFVDAYGDSDIKLAKLIEEERYGQVKMLSLDIKGLTSTIGAHELGKVAEKILTEILYENKQLLPKISDEYAKNLSILKGSIRVYLAKI